MWISKTCSIHSIILNSSILICHQCNVCICHMDRSSHCLTDCSSLVHTTASNVLWNTGTHECHSQCLLKLFSVEATGVSNIFLSSSIYVTFTLSQSYLHSVNCFMKQWKLTHLEWFMTLHSIAHTLICKHSQSYIIHVSPSGTCWSVNTYK